MTLVADPARLLPMVSMPAELVVGTATSTSAAASTTASPRTAGTLRPMDDRRAHPLRLLAVALDRVGVAHLRGVGVVAGVAQRAALAQEVPAAVELDPHPLQAGGGGRRARAPRRRRRPGAAG